MGTRSTIPRIAKGQDDLASARRSLAKASERLAYAPTLFKKALSRIHTASGGSGIHGQQKAIVNTIVNHLTVSECSRIILTAASAAAPASCSECEPFARATSFSNFCLATAFGSAAGSAGPM